MTNLYKQLNDFLNQYQLAIDQKEIEYRKLAEKSVSTESQNKLSDVIEHKKVFRDIIKAKNQMKKLVKKEATND